jgi:hypothetical protein
MIKGKLIENKHQCPAKISLKNKENHITEFFCPRILQSILWKKPLPFGCGVIAFLVEKTSGCSKLQIREPDACLERVPGRVIG